MINNIQDYFSKYKDKLSTKKEIENNIIDLIYINTNIKLNKSNLKIDSKNKNIKIINLRSSVNFYLKDKVIKNNIDGKLREKLNFNLIN